MEILKNNARIIWSCLMFIGTFLVGAAAVLPFFEQKKGLLTYSEAIRIYFGASSLFIMEIFFVVIFAVNIKRLYRFIFGFVESLAEYFLISLKTLPKGRFEFIVFISMIFIMIICFLFFYMLINNVVEFSRRQHFYISKTFELDIRNRELALANKYYRSGQMESAARIYRDAFMKYRDQYSIDRLIELEKRYRLFRIGVSSFRFKSDKSYISPFEYYMISTIWMLHPRSNIVPRRFYRALNAGDVVLEAFKRTKNECLLPTKTEKLSSQQRKDLILLLEYRVYLYATTRPEGALRWYCSLQKNNIYNIDVFRRRWQIDDFNRIQSIRNS